VSYFYYFDKTISKSRNMKKIILVVFICALGTLGRSQHLETTVKVVNGKARIAVKAVGGDITGAPSGTTFCIAVPIANASATLDLPTILDASRLPKSESLVTGTYQDVSYKYFILLWAGAASSATFADNTEYELLELTWGGPKQSFPISLVSLSDGNKSAPVLPFQWANYLETAGYQRSFGDQLFYKSATSTEPVQMAKDYSTGFAKVTTRVAIKTTEDNNVIPDAMAIGGLYPNPARDKINVIINAPQRDNLTLIVTDVLGRTLKQQIVNVEAGSNTVAVDIANLAQGSYMVKVLCKSSDCQTATAKFNKQ
jgi:hypothetical protein